MSFDERMTPGKLVAFEGIDGAGKSSVVTQLPHALADCKRRVRILGEFESPIAGVFKNNLDSITSFQKTFLFAADRAWTYETHCLPSLAAGDLVLWDRYVDSALAYRAVDIELDGGLVNSQLVKNINEPFRQPDITIFIDISVETSLLRKAPHSAAGEARRDILARVRSKYRELASERGYVVIDGEMDLAVVVAEASAAIRKRFGDIF